MINNTCREKHLPLGNVAKAAKHPCDYHVWYSQKYFGALSPPKMQGKVTLSESLILLERFT